MTVAESPAPRATPGTKRTAGQAEPALRDPPGSGSLVRFGKTVRWFHGTFALSFVALAGTGAALALRGPLGIGAGTGGRILAVHLAAAVCLSVLPAVVVLSGDTRAFLDDLAGLARWSRDDLRWLALQPLAFVKDVALPPAGKLNAGQKVNGLAMGALTVGLAASGLVLWLRPGALLPLAVHVACFLAWMPLFAGHLMLALVLPGTRPALGGMITGRVPRAWARHHHPRWVEEVEARERAAGRP